MIPTNDRPPSLAAFLSSTSKLNVHAMSWDLSSWWKCLCFGTFQVDQDDLSFKSRKILIMESKLSSTLLSLISEQTTFNAKKSSLFFYYNPRPKKCHAWDSNRIQVLILKRKKAESTPDPKAHGEINMIYRACHDETLICKSCLRNLKSIILSESTIKCLCDYWLVHVCALSSRATLIREGAIIQSFFYIRWLHNSNLRRVIE